MTQEREGREHRSSLRIDGQRKQEDARRSRGKASVTHLHRYAEYDEDEIGGGETSEENVGRRRRERSEPRTKRGSNNNDVP